MVCVDLSETEIDFTICADRCYEGDPGLNRLGVDAVHHSMLSPPAPVVVLEIDPSLIYIDDSSALVQ